MGKWLFDVFTEGVLNLKKICLGNFKNFLNVAIHISLQFLQNKIRHFIIQMQTRSAAVDTMISIRIKISIVLFVRRNQGICHFD